MFFSQVFPKIMLFGKKRHFLLPPLLFSSLFIFKFYFLLCFLLAVQVKKTCLYLKSTTDPSPSPTLKRKEESGMKVLMCEDNDECNHQTY